VEALGIPAVLRPSWIGIPAFRPFCHELCQVPRVLPCG